MKKNKITKIHYYGYILLTSGQKIKFDVVEDKYYESIFTDIMNNILPPSIQDDDFFTINELQILTSLIAGFRVDSYEESQS